LGQKDSAAMIMHRAHTAPLKRALLLPALATLWATLLPVAPLRAADDLIVKYDQSQILRLPRPAAEIIIGNPAVADVTVQSGNVLVVTGKTFGITNFIALDAARDVIQEMRILVNRDEAKVVNLQRGTQRQSYNCTPQCNPSIVIGDETAYFDSVSAASQKKITFSERSADTNGQNANQ
jgi:Flp pilus assembly secretin CpaC